MKSNRPAVSSPQPPRPTTSTPAKLDRPPPLRQGQWTSPTLKLDIHALPPLPDIRSKAVADRARSTAPAPAGKHRNELESAGIVYSAAVSEELYRDTPASRRAVVQRVRAMLTSQSRPCRRAAQERGRCVRQPAQPQAHSRRIGRRAPHQAAAELRPPSSPPRLPRPCARQRRCAAQPFRAHLGPRG